MIVLSNRNGILLGIVFVAFVAGACSASPDASDGVDVLFMLCEPYGANTALLWNNFERLGWDVTIAGTNDVIDHCSFLTTDVQADRTYAALRTVAGFDVVALSSTPGTFAPRPDPAADLRGNDHVLDLIREADTLGLTLYAGCASLLALGDAGVLDGRNAMTANRTWTACRDYGASCTVGDFDHPPAIDEHVVTATNQRYYALEIPEAIARSLDRLDDHPRTIANLAIHDLSLSQTALPKDHAVVRARTWGTVEADGVLAVCPFGDGFVVAGYTFGRSGGNADALIARFDADAELVWAKALGGPGRDYAYGIVATEDGVVVAGLTTSAGAGGEDAFLAKLSPSGVLAWAQTYGGAGHDAAFALTATVDGGFAIAGSTETPEGEHSSALVIRTDAEGRAAWTESYDGRRFERGLSIIERADGTLLVAGGTTSSGAGNYDMLLLAYTPDGEFLWKRTQGRRTFDIAEAICETQTGELVAVGYGDVEGGDPNDVVLVRFAEDGTRQSITVEGPKKSFDYGQDLLELPDGDLFVVAVTGAQSTGANDLWLQRFSPTGDLLWDQRFGLEAESEWASAVCALADGSLLVGGWTLSAGVGSQDLLLAFVDPAFAR